MAKRVGQYETTTRSGEKVRVIHGDNGRGERVSILSDGRGYERLHLPHNKK